MKEPLPEDIKLLRMVAVQAGKSGRKVYLVGGFLRDLFLGRRKENPDMDFAVDKGAVSFGRALNVKLKAGFVMLDRERRNRRRFRKKRFHGQCPCKGDPGACRYRGVLRGRDRCPRFSRRSARGQAEAGRAG